VRSEGQFRFLRSLSWRGAAVADRGNHAGAMAEDEVTEVRRILALIPGRNDTAAGKVNVVDEVGLPPACREALAAGLGAEMDSVGTLSGLGVGGAFDNGNDVSAGRLAAAALAMAGLSRDPMALDFVHSRLQVKKHWHVGRQAFWAACGLLVVIGFIAFYLVDRSAREREVADLRTRLSAMQPDIEAARRVVDRVSSARGWYDRRPQFLECLRSLTLSLPESGSIWAKGLVLQEDMHGLVTGKAGDERLIVSFLDTLMVDEQFRDVKLLYIRGAEGRSSDSDFGISFSYVGTGVQNDS
jgi:hypothetical protein